MNKYLYLFSLFIIVVGLFAQSDNKVIVQEQEQEQEKCAKVVYLNESSELLITNPVETEYLVQIYNLTGRVVKKVENVKPEVIKINISELIKGIYLVKITPVPYLTSSTFKVVIK